MCAAHVEPSKLEGKIVRIVDRVAYINHDIDDAVRAGVLDPDDLPAAEIELLGPTGSRRIDALVHDLVETSAREGDIRQSEEVGAAMLALRSFMFEHVYLGEPARALDHRQRQIELLVLDGGGKRSRSVESIQPDECIVFQMDRAIGSLGQRLANRLPRARPTSVNPTCRARLTPRSDNVRARRS